MYGRRCIDKSTLLKAWAAGEVECGHGCTGVAVVVSVLVVVIVGVIKQPPCAYGALKCSRYSKV